MTGAPEKFIQIVWTLFAQEKQKNKINDFVGNRYYWSVISYVMIYKQLSYSKT